MRDPIKLKVIEALEAGSLDESKFRDSISKMVDLIIDQAMFEAKEMCLEMVRRLEQKEPVEPTKDHRTFGKMRHPGDPK